MNFFRPSFGIAFDIDGVVLRGRVPIGGSPQALRRLYGDSGTSQLCVCAGLNYEFFYTTTFCLVARKIEWRRKGK